MRAINKNKTAALLKPTVLENIVSVLLIEEHSLKDSLLKKTILDLNYSITNHAASTVDLLEQVEKYNPDLLVMNLNSPNQKILSALFEINQLSPLPIIIFAEQDTPNVLRTSIKAGVSAYVINEIHPHRLKSIFSVAIERFKELQSLKHELEQTKAQLESRKLVERAKGLIMQQRNMSEQSAYKTLRKMAMDNGNSLAMVAKNVIDVCQLLTPSENKSR